MHSLFTLARPLAPPLCFGCRSISGPDGGPLCPRCRAALAWLGPEPVELGEGGDLAAWAPLAYRGAAAALVRGLKFGGALPLARTMAAQMFVNAPRGWLGPGAALVPVPMHPGKRRRRGFNHAERLAQAVAALAEARVSDVLARSGPRTSQVGRGRDQRQHTAAGAIHVRRPTAVPDRAVLIDDVITTGATARACAAALRSAGCKEVKAIAYARTPGR